MTASCHVYLKRHKFPQVVSQRKWRRNKAKDVCMLPRLVNRRNNAVGNGALECVRLGCQIQHVALEHETASFIVTFMFVREDCSWLVSVEVVEGVIEFILKKHVTRYCVPDFASKLPSAGQKGKRTAGFGKFD